MMRLTWLADTLRNAGLRVREQPNWLSRGEAFEFQPIGVVCHHTSSLCQRICRPDRIGTPASDGRQLA